MRCQECRHWFRGTSRKYKDNPTVFTPSAEENKGICRSGGAIDGQIVPAVFGCINFVACSGEFEQVDFLVYDREPWQMWEMIPCPDCSNGTPGAACDRCTGTGNVRKYADGYIGDERTREHPVEREMRLERLRQELMSKMRVELEELEKGTQTIVETSDRFVAGGAFGPV